MHIYNEKTVCIIQLPSTKMPRYRPESIKKHSYILTNIGFQLEKVFQGFSSSLKKEYLQAKKKWERC